eukprot:TRINITY_DN9012_c0_g1_i1.p3 TRINITY_DN9012_c0_g1~~TRINITY_DN9012_c0_g1_i1.p3  ORF type:complete len:300 (+),score=76.72 TRINITY_DN9012_c0_g1_i1:302-1201(+)
MQLWTHGRSDVAIKEDARRTGDNEPPMVERRVDPNDGQAYTEAEFLECYGGGDEWRSAELWTPATGRAQLRIDPQDGRAYTKQSFVNVYGGTAEWDAAKVYEAASSESSPLSAPGTVAFAAAAPKSPAGARAAAVAEGAGACDLLAARVAELERVNAAAEKNLRQLGQQVRALHPTVDVNSAGPRCPWCRMPVAAPYCMLTGRRHVTIADAKDRRDKLLQEYAFTATARSAHSSIGSILHVVAFADHLGIPDDAVVMARAWLQRHLARDAQGRLAGGPCRPWSAELFAPWCPPRCSCGA